MKAGSSVLSSPPRYRRGSPAATVGRAGSDELRARTSAATPISRRGHRPAEVRRGMRGLVYGPVQDLHEHRFRPQPAGSLTLRQFVESLRRWTPEMRQVAQIALTRSESERRQYLQGFHARHHERQPQAIDSFVRWAYSDPRLDF